jgi:hypothetical protein
MFLHNLALLQAGRVRLSELRCAMHDRRLTDRPAPVMMT